MPKIIKSLWDIAGEDLYKKIMSPDYVPEQTERAYKLFRTDGEELYPLFVDAKNPVPVGSWERAIAGERRDNGKVRSRIGDLAWRPGWHAGDGPMATHIGTKSKKGLKDPDTRRPNEVWAEVDMARDVDWQTEANSRSDQVMLKSIRDTVPYGGNYRFKTNPNMTGDWHIGGDMRVNRVLSDEEVLDINADQGLFDLVRREKAPLLDKIREKYGAVTGATTAGLLAAGQSGESEAGVLKLIAGKSVKELVEMGYPKEVAKKIHSGELPMDEASREARAQAMNMQEDWLWRGHSVDRPPTSDQDFWASKSMDSAQTYNRAANDGFEDIEGLTALRTNVPDDELAYVRGDGKSHAAVTSNSRKIKGGPTGMYYGTDQIAEAAKESGNYKGTLFHNIKDDFNNSPDTEKADVYNILASRDDVIVREPYAAAYDPDYKGNNIMGNATVPMLGTTAALSGAALLAPHIKDSGFISSPRSEGLFNFTMGARDLERRLEGSPASLLFPSGAIDYLETVNRREEDPNWLTRAMALADFL